MKQHYRTLWLSDIHLGSKDCKADFLLEMLDKVQCDTLYLVGDIIDMWAMSKQFHWPEKHNQVLHKLWMLSETGTRVVYLPGNHDAPIQQYSGLNFSNVEIRRELMYVTAAGKRVLMLHGDRFDDEVCLGKFHVWIGDKGYDFLLWLNRNYNYLAQSIGIWLLEFSRVR